MTARHFTPAIVWFRRDLRLADNPALQSARARGRPVLPVFIWSPEEEGGWPPGATSCWWLHHSLKSLDSDLRRLGSRLMILRGPAAEALQSLANVTGAGAIFWNRRYEPAAIRQEDAVLDAFGAQPCGPGSDHPDDAGTGLPESLLRRLAPCRGRDGMLLRSYNASLLHEPWEIAGRSGKPFQVFTPFWRSCLSRGGPPPPLPAPRTLASPPNAHAVRRPACSRHAGLRLEELDLLPHTDWTAELAGEWTPGRKGASQRLRRFLAEALAGYPHGRDRPDTSGTSRISPHLGHGEIGVREVWAAVRRHAAVAGRPGEIAGSEEFLREIGWREFAYHLLFHFPHTPGQPLRDQFRLFPWRKDPGAMAAWQRGKTGYPLIDSGMRELWTIGWMHNRVRMAAASFLVKDLLLPWQEGARWFWDTLVDADLANNTLGWQWISGCGADAAPYFRIFNPVRQGLKFDPEGVYVRRWAPELASVPDRWVHHPFDAPPDILSCAGVRPGRDYPAPLVDHGAARLRALAALKRISKRSGA